MVMELNQQQVDAYKTILNDPQAHGMPFKPLKDNFTTSDEVIAKHLLWEQFEAHIERQIPKVIFYILMDETYPELIGKGLDGNAGYKLKIKTNEES